MRCPRPLGSCSPVCPVRVSCCLCGVLGHLAPVHQCVHSFLCFACAVSSATWLLFTAVPAQGVVLRVRCPGPLGSCSPVCPLGALLCVCCVLGHLPPVHWCARSVCCVGCAVSRATWLLFAAVLPRCVDLWVACAVVRVQGVAAGRTLSPCGHRLFVARQGLSTLRARTRPSRRRLFVAGGGWLPSGRALICLDGGCFVAGRGWVRCWARTGQSGRRLFVACTGWVPSGCALVHPDGAWCCLVPVLVPWFVACCARSPGLRHLKAVVAWHLSMCLGCGGRLASLACLVAPRGAPRLVRSGRSRCSGRLPRRGGAFPHPGGLRPRFYWVAARGTRRPAGNRAHCDCRWPRPKRGRWARSASYPFGTPRWGCPWRVPPASVLGCKRCGGWHVRSRSLTCPVSCAVCRSTGDSAGAPGLFCVDAVTCHCGSEDAKPGSRACVHVLVLPGRVGRAGLLGTLWCASPYPFAALSFCFARPPPGLGCAFPVPGCASFFFFALFSLCASVVPCFLWFTALAALDHGALFFFPPPPVLGVFFFSSCPMCAPGVPGFLWFPAPGPLGLGAVCCLFCWSAASRLRVRSRCFCVSSLAARCYLVVAAPPAPPLPFCVSRFSSLPLGAPFFCFCCLLCSCLLARRSSACSRRLPPPFSCLCCWSPAARLSV